MQTNIYAPVIGGNYADPSVIRVGADYYMTHSSYKLTPGLIIWHSCDLLQWKPVSAALTEFLGDVWAPDFVEHKGTYYIYFPANRSNWVVTAPSPTGPWSRPVNLGISGIDPGHTAGPDGKRYLHMSGGYIVELADDGLSVTGEPRRVYEGWRYPDDWVVEAYSLEGPKVTYRDGYYYLTVAVGGTAGPPTSHMAVSSRSRTPFGPWEHSPYNPIVHTYSAAERWWSKGHGSLIDSEDGRWWIVYHAYLNGFHTLGRQTLIQPIEWTEDGWFKTGDSELERRPPEEPFVDEFDGDALGLHWQCEGVGREERFSCARGALTAAGAPEDAPSSPLLFMPSHERYEAEVEVEASAAGDAEGRVLLYYNDTAYFGMGVSARGVRHFRSFKNYYTVPGDGRKAWVRIRNDRHIVSFHYSFDGKSWAKYDKVIDASGFHHNTFGGFQSLRIGLDAAGSGEVVFRRFIYRSAEGGDRL
ncbi:family 43 glycosylhydrolase [Paenibacillus alkalitolerans]|uniref:family 43 glycosylhydrolase n=1 Tax=Paenibacillus alkalitolerans TaxID=2799335 RepID=UPI001F3442E4|nr:family 43 glycosylhydrolase [Paenibacillus alkalitolerans]